MLAAKGVELVLAGHAHVGWVGSAHVERAAGRRSVLIVQAGTALSHRRRGEQNAYNWIAVERDRVRIEVREYDGARFAAAGAVEYALRDGRWTELAATPPPAFGA
jgi:hypothetical protein